MTWLIIILCWAICDVLFAFTWAVLFYLGRDHSLVRALGRKTLELHPSRFSLARGFDLIQRARSAT
jgi:hypothetical protein